MRTHRKIGLLAALSAMVILGLSATPQTRQTQPANRPSTSNRPHP